MSKTAASESSFNKTRPLNLAIGFFFFLVFLAVLNGPAVLAQNPLFPRLPIKWVKLFTNDKEFNKNMVVQLDFSLVPCCRILTDEYESTTGVRFENTIAYGWATDQANNFASHLSGSPRMPGAPTGITGTRIILSQNTRKVGMHVQAGSPFNSNAVRPSKEITVRAYNNRGEKIFERTSDTCLEKASGCQPQFVGVKSALPLIRALEIVINEPYNWSIDDLKWEPWRKITPSPTVSPTPFPTIYPSASPLPTLFPSYSPIPTTLPLPSEYPGPYPTIIPLPTIYPTVYPSAIPLPSLGPTTYPDPIPITTPLPTIYPSPIPIITPQPSVYLVS